MSEEKLSYKVAKKMLATANFENALGVELVNVDEGFAKVRMEVTDMMKNGHGTCQGGAIFSFADAAFALACNSRNVATVAQACDISFVKPAFLGDVLTATASEKYIKGKSGIYDVVVVNQKFESVAFFTGKSRAIPGTVLEDEEL
ncbi:hydroxyphenylacetyl-CoA thioesterase PaaI [Arcobacter sp. LA11]|uniref:hydroxyphenylacetyl-CoA thioesterase PaaI n=1 Tax=Arcobacter sp. LA11 TaxID=1898176 RepID=UPI0009332128|nr:hydroxyphenylacetyl-CoA thioesterase PaaI [Arcobacter sp. LA11]